MSERIHAFGENGELSEGAEKALDAYWLANGGGGGATVHEDLTGRSDPNQHPIGAITGLTATLANKSDADHEHTAAQISDATTTGRVLMQATSAIAARTSIGAAASTHTHDDRYYTESEVDAALAGKADTSHQHSVSDLTTTGTPSATTYLRGDGAWATPEGGGGGPQIINEQTGTSYTLGEDDVGAVITVDNAASITLRVPASVFTAGQRVDVIQRGAGAVTLTAGFGMTLRGTPSLVTRAQWSAVSVLFLSTSEAVVIGDLAEPGGTGGRG